MSIIEKARKDAEAAHKNDKRVMGEDKGKSYFHTHVERVAHAVSEGSVSLGLYSEEIVAAAYLHDVVEDHGDRYSLEYVRDHYGDKVADIVDGVTHRKGESYLDYVLRAIKSPEAAFVKEIDLKDNMRDLREGQMKDKYRFALYLIIKDRMDNVARKVVGAY